jgi:S1-C subfamily serine protease
MNVTLTLRRATAVVLLASAITSAGCASAPTPRAKSREEILGRILPTAVQVIVEQHEGRRIRSGSGVAIASRRTAEGPSCFVLTSGHTVSGLEGKTEVYAVFGRHLGPGRKARALVVAQRNDIIDLALLQAESEECAPVSLASAPLLGEAIWVIGFPLGRHIMLSSGVVSQVALDDASDPAAIAARLIVDAPVNYGVSGGGVFDARTGGLIGVVEGFSTARLTAHGATPSWYIDVPVPGQTLVTPLADIKRFLRESEHAQLLPP